MAAAELSNYLTLDEAAKRLGIFAGSLRRLAIAGRAPAVKPRVLGVWVFERDELERFAEGYDRRPGRKSWPLPFGEDCCALVQPAGERFGGQAFVCGCGKVWQWSDAFGGWEEII